MRLIVDLDAGSEPPSGWLTGDDGERQQFVGLLELFGLIEALHRRASTTPPAGSQE